MNKSKKLLRSDIRYECGDSSYEQGRTYFDNGQVVKLAVKSEGTLFVQINSSVKGSHTHPYQQNIRIAWRPDYSAAQIKGDCSCVVGYNCKHVAAACLMYQNSNQALSSLAETNSSCLAWLDSLNESESVQRNIYQEFIAYILKPGNAKYEFTVALLITKANKSGRRSKSRKTNLNTLRYSYSFLNYIQPEDEEIAKLLTVLNSYKGEPLISGALGYITLAKLLKTGRLFWESADNPPLKAGLNRDLHFDWRQLDRGNYRLLVEIEPAAMLLLTDPPQYLDPDKGTIGALNSPAPTADQLNKILSIPIIPAEYADEFSFKLTVEHTGLQLPTPKKVEVTDQNELAPIPRLLLYGQQLDAQHYVHLMLVSFKYGAWTLSAAIPPADHSIVKTDRGFVRIKRAQENELQAIDCLANFGFTAAPPEKNNSKDLVLFSEAGTVIDSALRWRDFLQNTIPEFERDGWITEVADSFKLNFQTAQNWVPRSAKIRMTGLKCAST